MNEWNVIVEGVGYIGTVCEKNEEMARCAALSKFGEKGERVSAVSPDRKPAIYEDDEFSVSKR